MRGQEVAQSWWGSIAEAKTNILIGFGLNYGANCLLLPWLFDPAHTMRSAFYIGLWFTAISIVRQLVIRRWFNGMARFETKAEARP